LRNLEAKLLKTAKLAGLLLEMEPGATPLGRAESKSLKEQVSLLREIIGKWAVGEDVDDKGDTFVIGGVGLDVCGCSISGAAVNSCNGCATCVPCGTLVYTFVGR
jgi:hypothetical protein